MLGMTEGPGLSSTKVLSTLPMSAAFSLPLRDARGADGLAGALTGAFRARGLRAEAVPEVAARLSAKVGIGPVLGGVFSKVGTWGSSSIEVASSA
jgi:hypothetical protein